MRRRLPAVRRRPGAILAPLLLAAALAAGGSGCLTQEVPITGRRQLALVPAGQLRRMAVEQYGAFLKEHELSTDRRSAALVEKAGRRIRGAVERYFALHGWSDRLEDYRWEFRLVEDEQVNAFCMPGGKVVFYTGILPVTRDEDGLAVVMAHEIAHAVAQHGRERMSQALLVSLGGLALDKALEEQGGKTRAIFGGLYGVGTTLKMLSYSRQQEFEADRLGLVFMALAGYDPNAAVGLWQRMKAMKEKKGGGAPPVFLSTHPTDDQRIAAIRRLIPEAKRRARELRAAEARGGPVRSGAPPAQPTRRTASTRNEPAGRADRVETIRRETERLRRENRELRRKLEMR